MARAKRSTGVLDTLSKRGEAAVRGARKRVTSSTRAARSSGPAPELVRAVQSLVKALPLSELEKICRWRDGQDDRSAEPCRRNNGHQ